MSSGTRDYYATLGVPRDASEEEIKRAFRRKARETHPDVAGHHGAEGAFKEINEAYEVLSDPRKRQAYDRFGTTDPRAGFGQGVDFGDLFSAGIGEVFSTFFGGGFAGAGSPSNVGRDMVTQVVVSLEEAAAGVSSEITLTRDAPCEDCGATGVAGGGNTSACTDCGGTGRRKTSRRTFLGVMESVTPCPTCEATGTVIEDPCRACQGTGRVRRTEQLEVQVPAGVHDGQSLRLGGRGEAGFRGGQPGDLIVNVRIAAHEYLHRDGDDLHARAELTVTQAALGAEVVVPGLEGDVTVKVPAGSQNGDVVQVRGEGMVRGRGGRGDLFVHLAVAIPKKLTKKQRELLEELDTTLRDGSTSPLQRLKDWLSA